MNKRKLLKDLERAAQAMGKELETRPVKKGVHVSCEGRWVTLSHHSVEPRYPKAVRRLLGLAQQSRL